MQRSNIWLDLCLALAVIGAINWGLVGFFNWNLVNAIFGGPAHPDAGTVSRVIYAIVGLAGLGLAAFAPRLAAATPTTARRRSDVVP